MSSKAKSTSKKGPPHMAVAPAKSDKPAKRQRVIPEDPTHTWSFMNAEAEAAWRAAGISVEDDAIDLSSEGVLPSDMTLPAQLAYVHGMPGTRMHKPQCDGVPCYCYEDDSDELTLGQAYATRGFSEAAALLRQPAWVVVGNLLRAARQIAQGFACPVCDAKAGSACDELGLIHTERVALTLAEVQSEAVASIPALLAMPPELAVECPHCKARGFLDAGGVGQPCVQTIDFQLGATSADLGPCAERIVAARHGDAASIRRKWSLASASVAEYLVDLGVTAWEADETHGAQRLYLAARGLEETLEQPEGWPGWAAVRAQLVPDTIVTGPLEEEAQVVVWPSQVEIITAPKHPHLFCRRALRPPDADLIGQIEAYGGVREFVWITMCDRAGQLVREGGQLSMVAGRRRGIASRAINTQRITAALYDLRVKPRGEVEPPTLLPLHCRFTADPERVAVIKDTENHGRLAEDLLRQADGVANLAKPVRRCVKCHELAVSAATSCPCGAPIVEKGRSCRDIAKLMSLSTQTVANLLSLTLLDAEVRQALERSEFSVFSGYKLAKEDPTRQREALAATAGLSARERGPAIERFLAGKSESDPESSASKSWKAKDVKGLADRLLASRNAEVQQFGQVLAYLTGKGSLKGLPKAVQRALSNTEANP